MKGCYLPELSFHFTNFYFKLILPAVKYGLVLCGLCCNSDLFRAACIIYNLPKDMVSEDMLRYVKCLTFSVYYKLDILRFVYRAHSKSLPDTLYEKICQNRVNT